MVALRQKPAAEEVRSTLRAKGRTLKALLKSFYLPRPLLYAGARFLSLKDERNRPSPILVRQEVLAQKPQVHSEKDMGDKS